jgi:phage gp29-like protein
VAAPFPFRDRAVTLVEAAYEYALQRLRPAPGERGKEEAAPAPWSDRNVQVLGARATPDAVATIINQRNTGDLRQWADLADAARRSVATIHSEMSTREQSAQETDFRVLPGEGSNKRAARRAADACREVFARWQSRDDSGDTYGAWDRWVAEWVAAAYYPLAGHEVVWRRDARAVYPDACARVAERRFSYAADQYDPNPWTPRILDDEQPDSAFYQPPYGVPVSALHPDKVLMHRRRVVGGHAASEGMFSVLVWPYVFATSSWRDLMRLQEMLGVPPVIGYFAAGGAKADGAQQKMNGDRKATSDEIALARATLGMMTGALRALLPDTVRLEPLKYDLPATPIQLMTTDRLDKYVARIVNGTDGVSSIVPGSRASQQVAAEQAMTPYRSDARYCARQATILFARFVRANPDLFGANCPLPICVAETDPPASVADRLKLIKDAKDAGFVIPEAWAHEAAQIPLPGNAERVIGQPPEGEKTPPGGAPGATPPPAQQQAAA